MKSRDKKKTSELFEGVGSTLHQAFVGAVERDKNKPKELKWIKDWKQLNPNWTEVQISFIGSLLQDLEEEIRVQQRTELLEEIDKSCKETPEIIKKWKCSEKDGWYIKNVIDSFKSQLTNLLNKKDE